MCARQWFLFCVAENDICVCVLRKGKVGNEKLKELDQVPMESVECEVDWTCEPTSLNSDWNNKVDFLTRVLISQENSNP